VNTLHAKSPVAHRDVGLAVGYVPPKSSKNFEVYGRTLGGGSVACRGDSEVLIVEDNRDAAEMLAERILTSSRIELLELRDDELARFRQLFRVPPHSTAHAGRFSIFRIAQLRAALEQPK
jgi:hypothetical protein